MQDGRIKKIFLYFPLFISPLVFWAQKNTEAFPFHNIEYLSTKQGLLGDDVNWITQDRNGFMWITTQHGLSRYDGYSFKTYSYDPKQSASLSPGWYWGIEEDEEGLLWLPGETNGLFSFDPSREKFTQYLNQSNDSNSLAENKLWAVRADRNGKIWIGLKNKGLDKFDTKNGSFTHFVHNPNDKTSISDNTIYGLALERTKQETKNGSHLYIINGRLGIDYFDTGKEKVIKHIDFPYADLLKQWGPNNAGSISLNIGEIKNGMIWLGSNDKGIYGFDTKSEKFVHLKTDRPCISKNHVGGFYFVLEDQDGNLWTTNDNNEIVYYDSERRTYYYHQVKQNNISFIRSACMFLEDRNQSIWMGTDNGIIKIDRKQKKIGSASYSSAISPLPAENNVVGISRIRSGHLLVGTKTNISVFDKEENSFSPVTLKNGHQLDAGFCYKIFQDRRGKVWLLGNFGIIAYDPTHNSSHKIQLRDESGVLLSQPFRGMLEDRHNNLWLGDEDGCLLLFDPPLAKSGDLFMMNMVVRE